MSEDWGITIFALLVIAFAVFMSVMITITETRENERELVCVELEHEGYDIGHDACYSGENPMILVPYEKVFEVQQ